LKVAIGGGVGDRAFALLLCFPFLVMIEFAQDFTLRGLRPIFREELFGFSVVSTDGSSTDMGEVSGESNDLERAGSDALVGSVGYELVSWRESLWKRLRRLVGSFGVGVVGETGERADTGRLRSDMSLFIRLLTNMSNTAPAVLGRLSSSSTVCREGRPDRAGCGLLQPTMDERLFAAECPRNDIVASVSEEMVESGRIVSILSENVTRALDGGRAPSSSEGFSRNDGCETDLLNLWPNANGFPSEGVLGALPVREGVGAGTGGCIIVVRS